LESPSRRQISKSLLRFDVVPDEPRVFIPEANAVTREHDSILFLRENIACPPK
jgi:hypothetical protein